MEMKISAINHMESTILTAPQNKCQCKTIQRKEFLYFKTAASGFQMKDFTESPCFQTDKPQLFGEQFNETL